MAKAKGSDFIAQVKSQGLMRNNRYIVEMSLPRAMNRGGIDMRKVLLFCDSVTIPGVTLTSTPAKTYGEVREMPWERLFQPASMSFYVDNAMHVKKVFDEWKDLIQDPVTRDIGYYVNYTTDIQIEIFDIDENARYRVTLYEAYVKDIASITMDMANRDVMKLPVTFQYKYWKSTDAYSSVTPRDNRGFFEKLFGGFIGDTFSIPKNYFNNFGGFQKDYNTMTPNLGGQKLSGASYRF